MDLVNVALFAAAALILGQTFVPGGIVTPAINAAKRAAGKAPKPPDADTHARLLAENLDVYNNAPAECREALEKVHVALMRSGLPSTDATPAPEVKK